MSTVAALALQNEYQERREALLREIAEIEATILVLLAPTYASIVLSLNNFTGRRMTPQARLACQRAAIIIDRRIIRINRVRQSVNISLLPDGPLRRYHRLIYKTMRYLREFREFEESFVYPPSDDED